MNNGLIGEQSIPMQNMNHYGGNEIYLNQDLVASSQARLDPGILTHYGGGIFNYGPTNSFSS